MEVKLQKIGLFYGSNLGTTMEIAERIKDKLADKADVHNIADSSKELIQKYENLIFGTSTWGYGELQDDWSAFLEDNSKIDLNNKKVALFGLGDQDSHQDVFVNGMGKLFDYVKENGAEVIGFWPIANYEYGNDTTAVRNKIFVGLPIDEINQPELTEERINGWIEMILKEFN